VCTPIGAPPATVWRHVEAVETHTEWMRDAQAITFVGPQRRGVGTTFDCRTRVGPLHTTDRMVVVSVEPGASLGIEHRGAVRGQGELGLRPIAAGAATELCWDETLRFPWWFGGVIGEHVARPVLRRIWRSNLRALRAIAEERRPDGDRGQDM
jgi:hypothetical protein